MYGSASLAFAKIVCVQHTAYSSSTHVLRLCVPNPPLPAHCPRTASAVGLLVLGLQQYTLGIINVRSTTGAGTSTTWEALAKLLPPDNQLPTVAVCLLCFLHPCGSSCTPCFGGRKTGGCSGRDVIPPPPIHGGCCSPCSLHPCDKLTHRLLGGERPLAVARRREATARRSALG